MAKAEQTDGLRISHNARTTTPEKKKIPRQVSQSPTVEKPIGPNPIQRREPLIRIPMCGTKTKYEPWIAPTPSQIHQVRCQKVIINQGRCDNKTIRPTPSQNRLVFEEKSKGRHGCLWQKHWC